MAIINRRLEVRLPTPQIKEEDLVNKLIATELSIVDPDSHAEYVAGKESGDPADSMRADLAMWKRAATLREEGQMTPRDEIVKKAKTMVGLSIGEVQGSLTEYADAFRS